MKSVKDSLYYIRHKYYDVMKVVVFIIAILLVVWQIPRAGKFKYEFQKQKPWLQETLYAPFDFAIYKSDEQLKTEQDLALQTVYPMFVLNEILTNDARIQIADNFEKIWMRQDSVEKKKNKEVLLLIFDTIQNKGIIAYDEILNDKSQDSKINVIKEKVAAQTNLQDVYTIKSAFIAANEILENIDLVDYQVIRNLLQNGFIQNLIFDSKMTKQAIDQALSVISLTYGMVQKDELIVTEGEIVNDEKYSILNSLRIEYEKQVGTLVEQNSLVFGQTLLVFLIFSALFFYLWNIRKDIFAELRKINLLLLLMLLVTIPSFWILKLNPNYIFLMPLGMLPMLILTFFDMRCAIIVQLFATLIIGLVVPNPFQFLFMQLVIGFVAVYSLSNRYRRTSYFTTSLFIFLAYLIVYLGFSLIQEGSFASIDFSMIGSFALNALFTMLTLPIVYFLERIFGFVTDLTLLELSNTNSPILRKLASVAPGTFQHSMQVANLLEEALYEIGGNTLLARTGALYHDIGKIDNPLYFTENQVGGYSPHNDISNVESAQIIIGHVIKGVERARKGRIPEQIIDFIRTHHGNRRVEYFYMMEKKQNPEMTVDEREFSYHGPIPFSKETAVLMMADSVEAASRSIKEYNEQKINDLVENIINKQMESNQFINTDITLRDITTIKKVFKKKLMNIYHVRIAYPD